MKKIALALLAALTTVPLFAAPADVNALRNYLIRAMPKCPDSKITVEPISHVGPNGFIPYSATQTSSDTTCGAQNAVSRGNPKARIKIVELSDFQCPTCGKAHKQVEPIIAKYLSKIDYKRLDLPLFEHHEWALPAAAGAHAIQKVAPSKYWSYVNFVFENQEAIDKTSSFDETLKNFCEDHDVDWKKVEKIYR